MPCWWSLVLGGLIAGAVGLALAGVRTHAADLQAQAALNQVGKLARAEVDRLVLEDNPRAESW